MILVVSCYELGRQPFAVASALARLAQAGLDVSAQDVAVEKLSQERVRAADTVAISVPMHTALRLGTQVAERVRSLNPGARIAFFGLYAELNRKHLLEKHGDLTFASEDELVAALTGAPLQRRSSAVPSRAQLPVLDRYARLDNGALVASVEASRGCKHLCAHCPIVPVWRGKFVATPLETVLADIAQQVEQGATHVTFGDPDFFNGPTHALRIVRELRARWPHVTYDATIKIEHLLQHRALLPELQGCLFITSAVESLNSRVLEKLRKGHTAADAELAVQLVRDAGIELRPTFLPFTPWTARDDLPALFEYVERNELDVEAVQFTLRLLIPPGSAILEDAGPWLRELDEAAFGYRWVHELDELQRTMSAAAHKGAGVDELRALVGLGPARPSRKRAPRITEPWFC